MSTSDKPVDPVVKQHAADALRGMARLIEDKRNPIAERELGNLAQIWQEPEGDDLRRRLATNLRAFAALIEEKL